MAIRPGNLQILDVLRRDLGIRRVACAVAGTSIMLPVGWSIDALGNYLRFAGRCHIRHRLKCAISRGPQANQQHRNGSKRCTSANATTTTRERGRCEKQKQAKYRRRYKARNQRPELYADFPQRPCDRCGKNSEENIEPLNIPAGNEICRQQQCSASWCEVPGATKRYKLNSTVEEVAPTDNHQRDNQPYGPRCPA